jgi:hypothetical protein
MKINQRYLFNVPGVTFIDREMTTLKKFRKSIIVRDTYPL